MAALSPAAILAMPAIWVDSPELVRAKAGRVWTALTFFETVGGHESLARLRAGDERSALELEGAILEAEELAQERAMALGSPDFDERAWLLRAKHAAAFSFALAGDGDEGALELPNADLREALFLPEYATEAEIRGLAARIDPVLEAGSDVGELLRRAGGLFAARLDQYAAETELEGGVGVNMTTAALDIAQGLQPFLRTLGDGAVRRIGYELVDLMDLMLTVSRVWVAALRFAELAGSPANAQAALLDATSGVGAQLAVQGSGGDGPRRAAVALLAARGNMSPRAVVLARSLAGGAVDEGALIAELIQQPVAELASQRQQLAMLTAISTAARTMLVRVLARREANAQLALSAV